LQMPQSKSSKMRASATRRRSLRDCSSRPRRDYWAAWQRAIERGLGKRPVATRVLRATTGGRCFGRAGSRRSSSRCSDRTVGEHRHEVVVHLHETAVDVDVSSTPAERTRHTRGTGWVLTPTRRRTGERNEWPVSSRFGRDHDARGVRGRVTVSRCHTARFS
jgi:hypothetical protein